MGELPSGVMIGVSGQSGWSGHQTNELSDFTGAAKEERAQALAEHATDDAHEPASACALAQKQCSRPAPSDVDKASSATAQGLLCKRVSD